MAKKTTKKTTKKATKKDEGSALIAAATDAKPEARWKRLRDWPNYEVSECGRIRHRTTKKVRNIAPTPGNRAPWLTLQDCSGPEKRVKTIRLDRAVAGAWVGKPTKRKPYLAHIDGDRRNCAASNLEYRAERY